MTADSEMKCVQEAFGLKASNEMIERNTCIAMKLNANAATTRLAEIALSVAERYPKQRKD